MKTKMMALLLFVGLSPLRADTQLLYAATDLGTINVYDINNSHVLVKTIRFSPLTALDARGIAAAVPTHRLYVMFNSSGPVGHLVCIDLLTDAILFDKTIYSPRVDRGDVTPDGTKIYLPSNEQAALPYEWVVDALTGAVITKITQPTHTHDTIVSLDGTKAFMENKSADKRIHTIATSSNTETKKTSQLSGVIQPFTVNSDNTIAYCNVVNVYGYQWVNLTTGLVLGTANFTGTIHNGVDWPHGIALTPNGTRLWVSDRGTGNHFVHIFDVTVTPPVQTNLLTVSNDNPHWITFTIDGRFAYVAGEKDLNQPFDVVDATSLQRVASLPASEDWIEVDFNGGVVTAVGKQFGVGR